MVGNREVIAFQDTASEVGRVDYLDLWNLWWDGYDST